MKEENRKQKGYFVFFGPANVGKSTLVGYIQTKNWTLDALLKKEQKFKEQLGNKYRPDRYYTYFVDKNKDEYTKDPNQTDRNPGGTSKELHIRDMERFVLIDTPGDKRYKKQRHKGLSLANTGIFAVEIKQLLDLKEVVFQNRDKDDSESVRDFFSSWYVWQKLHGASNTIILLTKYDLHNGREDYETAKNVLAEIIGDEAINAATVIPTSVGLKIHERKDVNIFTKLDEGWYHGKTLLEAMEEKNNSICAGDERNDLLMFYNRDYNVRSVGYTIKWKIASGTISTKDEIKIAPVLLKKDNYTSVLAKIKSMQNAREELVELGEAGDIIGTALSNIVYENSTLPKKDVSICKTAIIVNKDREIKVGNKVIVSVNLDNCTSRERSIIEDVKNNMQVYLLWYGRLLYPRISAKGDTQENRKKLVLEFDKYTEYEGRYIALPKDMLPKRTLLQITKRQGDCQTEIACNYNCEVMDILIAE